MSRKLDSTQTQSAPLLALRLAPDLATALDELVATEQAKLSLGTVSRSDVARGLLKEALQARGLVPSQSTQRIPPEATPQTNEDLELTRSQEKAKQQDQEEAARIRREGFKPAFPDLPPTSSSPRPPKATKAKTSKKKTRR